MGFTGKKKRKTQRRMTAAQKRKLMLLTGLVFVCALFVVGIFYSSVYRYVHKMRPGQIEENVYVQGVDMSGLTKAQAKKKLKQNWEAVQNTHLILHDGEKEASVTVKQMGIRQGDVDEAIEKAAEYAKRGGLFHRYRKIRAAKKEKVEYDVSYKIDEEQIEDLLEEKTKDFYEEAEDAGITRVGGVFQITEEKSGETIDIDAVMKELEDKLPSLLLGEETRINVSAKKDEPKVTKTDLESIEDRIGEFATETQEEDRSILSRTAELLNGQVILTEKEISVQKILAPLLEVYEEENQEEKAETDIDCPEAFSQAASTLYMAVLDAELEVTKREPLDHEAAYTKPAERSADQKYAGLSGLYRSLYRSKRAVCVSYIRNKDKGKDDGDFFRKRDPGRARSGDGICGGRRNRCRKDEKRVRRQQDDQSQAVEDRGRRRGRSFKR